METPAPTAPKRRFRWGFRNGLLALLGLILWSEWALSLMRTVSSGEGTAMKHGVLLFLTLLPLMGLLVYRFQLVFDFFRSVKVGVTNLILIGLGAVVGVLFQQENPDVPVPAGAVEALAEASTSGDPAAWTREVRRAYGEYQDFRTAQTFFTYHLLNSMIGGRSVMGMDAAPGDPEEIQQSLDNLATRLPQIRDRFGEEHAIAIAAQTKTGLNTRAKNIEIRKLEGQWDNLWFTAFVWSDRLDFRRAYRSDWYSVMWTVLILGVFSNTFRGGWRRLLRWQKWGFLLTHTGVILVVIGGFQGRMSERRGILELHIGETSERFVLFKPAPDGTRSMEFREPSRLGEPGPLFRVGLEDFRADHHDVIDVIYAKRDETGRVTTKEFDLEDPKLRIFEGKKASYDWGNLDGDREPWLRLEVVEYAPQSEHDFSLEPAGDGEDGIPLARVELLGEGGVIESERVLADLGIGDDVVFHDPHTGVKVRLLQVADRAAAEAALAVDPRGGSWGELRLPPRTIDESPQTMAVRPGAKSGFALDGRDYEVEVLRVLPDFVLEMELQAGRIEALPEAQFVAVGMPAVEITVRSGADEETRWILEQDFPRDDLVFPELALLFRWDLWGAPAERRIELFAVDGEIFRGFVGEPGSLQAVPANDVIVLDDVHSLRIVEAYATGNAEDSYKIVAAGGFFDTSPPSIRLRVTMQDLAGDGGWTERVEEFVLHAGYSQQTGQQRIVSYTGPDGDQRDVVLRFREDRSPNELPVEWQSRLIILRDGEVASGDIRVNDYFHFEGFRFFQTNHDPADPTYSGIGVVYDPGIETVLAGLYMVMFGTAWVFLIQPILTRKHRGTD